VDEAERSAVEQARQNVRIVRADPTASWPAGTLEQADALLSQVLGETAPPTGQDEDWADLVSGAAGIAGAQKWFPTPPAATSSCGAAPRSARRTTAR
jgi:hypothetical protein